MCAGHAVTQHQDIVWHRHSVCVSSGIPACHIVIAQHLLGHLSHSKGHTAAQVAYLASTLFLDSNSDLIVLIVNTITRDLADDNMLIGRQCC